MRTQGLSLSKAAREAGTTSRTVVRLGKPALRKGSNGRYAAKPADRLLRVLEVPRAEGSRELAVRSSREATKLAKYWVAVHKYLQTGDVSEVEKFGGQFVKDATGREVPFLTDLDELKRLGFAGVLSFESIYSRAA